MFEVFWEPTDILVLLEHQRLLPLHIKEPARNRAVHDALLGTRVEWVFVANVFDTPGDALFHQILGDALVVLPYLETLIVRVKIVAVIVDNMERRDGVCLRQLKVVLAIGWRDMHNTRTRFVTDEICGVNLVNRVVFWPRRACVEWFIRFPN